MQDEISVHQHSSPPSQPSQPFESGSPQSPGSLTTSGAVDTERGRDGSAEGSVKDEEAPSKPKKPRLPRIAEACIRCKTRKQRCLRDPGAAQCKNCQGVNAECVIAPRVKRRSTKKVAPVASTSTAPPLPPYSAPSPSNYASAPSPASLQNLLQTSDHPPYDPRQEYARNGYPSSSFYHPGAGFSASPPFPPPSNLPSFPGTMAPPPPGVHFPYPPPPHALVPPSYPQLSPQLGSPSLGPPTSSLRSELGGMLPGPPGSAFPSGPPGGGAVGASQSPASASMAGTTPTSQPGTSRGGTVTEGEGNGGAPLLVKGDGDAMEYDEDESDSGEGEEDDGNWHDKAAKSVAFLSLSANGNPTYVGASSGFSWARFVLAGMSGAAASEGGKYSAQPTTSQPLRQLSITQQVLPDNSLQSIPDELADLIISQVYRHIQPRYSFLDWLYLHEIWAHRVVVCQRATQPGASKSLKTAAFFVWMVFAIGARFCQKLSIPNLASPEAYYAKAMEHLETIVGLHDLKNVQALMLMVMFSFRSSEAPSIWYLVGIIVRLCCSLGLHRKVPPPQARRMSPYILQLRRRIFWAAYTLDRMMAMSLGRPSGISDSDIDIELPLDYGVTDRVLDPQNSPTSPTSMSSSIQFIKLMRIESRIQKQVYRVDRPCNDRPEALLAQIDEWEANIPSVAADETCWQLPCCSRDWFTSRGADARMYLLRPLTVDPKTAEPQLVRLIAKIAADACEIQKRLHQSPESTLSLEGLRCVFLCGLTLLHAVQVDRNSLSPTVLTRAIRAESNTLFLYAQQYRGGNSYSEVFGELADAVLDKLAKPEEAGPPVPPPNLQPAVATPLFQSLWDDIPSMMTTDTQDSLDALLESLGLPTDSYGSSGPYSAATNGNSLDLAEIGAFAPSSGLEFEPFALGGSGGW